MSHSINSEYCICIHITRSSDKLHQIAQILSFSHFHNITKIEKSTTLGIGWEIKQTNIYQTNTLCESVANTVHTAHAHFKYLFRGLKCARSIHIVEMYRWHGNECECLWSCVVFILLLFSLNVFFGIVFGNDFIYDKHLINKIASSNDVNLFFSFFFFSNWQTERSRHTNICITINRLHGKWLSDKKCIMFSSCRIVSMRNGIMSIVQWVCCCYCM